MSIFNRRRVAVIRYAGTITAQNVSSYIKLLKKLEKMKSIKGVMFVIDSPGGSAVHSELLYYAVKRLRKKGKKVFGYLEVSASGGYMIACALERLYAPPMAIICSIGVISIKPVLKGVMEKLGIDYEVVKKGKHKDMWLFTRNYSDEERTSINELQDEIYYRFVEIVSEARGINLQDTLSLATGELFSSKSAAAKKLIDEVSDFDKALEDLCESLNVNPNKVINLSIKKPLFQRIISISIQNAVEDIYYRLMY